MVNPKAGTRQNWRKSPEHKHRRTQAPRNPSTPSTKTTGPSHTRSDLPDVYNAHCAVVGDGPLMMPPVKLPTRMCSSNAKRTMPAMLTMTRVPSSPVPLGGASLHAWPW